MQFCDGRLVGHVRYALDASGLAPGRLDIELIEGVLRQKAKRPGATMCELDDSGVRPAVDEFGTGCISLSCLRSFPFDVIEIDRQFIGDIESIAGDRAIVQAILALGKAFGLAVTAEDVATDRQVEILVEGHCTEGAAFCASVADGNVTDKKLLDENLSTENMVHLLLDKFESK